MARITVEDCIDKFPSRFELVLIASNRARKLHTGENPTIETDNDKNTVIALREIAEETITINQLKNDLIVEYQTNTFDLDEDLNEIENDEDTTESELNDLVKDSTETELNDLVEDQINQDNENENHSDDNDTLTNKSIEASEDNLDNSLDEDKVQD